jgi:hypothetical protein
MTRARNSKKEEATMVKRFSYWFILSVFLLAGIATAQTEQKTTGANALVVQEKIPAVAEEAAQLKEEVVKGIIKEIAPDGSFIIIENTKVLTTKEFLDDSYLETGDNVEVTAETTDSGLKAKNYNYIFEEEGPSAISEEPPTGESQGY